MRDSMRWHATRVWRIGILTGTRREADLQTTRGSHMQRSFAVWSARFLLVIAGLLIGEAALQIVSAVSPSTAARLSGLKPRYIADPVLEVRGDPESPEYDEAGFRNAERHARASVVVIGDSHTEGSGVARSNTWPSQLTRMTGVDVYQMAFGSYGPGQYLHLIDDALALSPATVIVEFYFGNDLAEAYDWVYGKRRNPELRSTDPAVLRELADADRERGPIGSEWRATRDAERGFFGRPVIRWVNNNVLDNSKLVALYDQVEWRITGHRSRLDADAEPGHWEEIEAVVARVPPDILFPYEDGGFRTVFTSQGRLNAVSLEDPRIVEGLRITLSIFDRIAATAAGRARLIALLIPTKEMVFGPRVIERASAAPSAFRKRIEAEERIRVLMTTALRDDRGIQVVDSLDSMRSAISVDGPLTADLPLYFDSWDGHPAVGGHQAIARAMADAHVVEAARADAKPEQAP